MVMIILITCFDIIDDYQHINYYRSCKPVLNTIKHHTDNHSIDNGTENHHIDGQPYWYLFVQSFLSNIIQHIDNHNYNHIDKHMFVIIICLFNPYTYQPLVITTYSLIIYLLFTYLLI